MSNALVPLGRERSSGADADARERPTASGARGGLRLFRNAHWYFACLLVVVLLGFAPGYTSVFRTASWSLHAHAVTMVLWLLLLIAQTVSIRTRRYRLHRALGRTSYALVPVLLLTGVLVTQEFLRRGDDGVTEPEITSTVLAILALPMFATCYVLAMRSRKRPALHARWMTAATLVASGAAFLRYFAFPLGLGTRLGGHASYLLIEFILVGLITYDWRQAYRPSPFIPLLAVHLTQHAVLEYGTSWAWWRALVEALHG